MHRLPPLSSGSIKTVVLSVSALLVNTKRERESGETRKCTRRSHPTLISLALVYAAALLSLYILVYPLFASIAARVTRSYSYAYDRLPPVYIDVYVKA